MSQPAAFWQKYGTLAQMAQAAVALLGFVAIKTAGRDERVQYETFVTYFLYACEEAISAFANRREWQASCDYDLRPHLPFLCAKSVAEPAYLATYGSDTQQWIKTAMKTASVTPPDCKLGKT